MADSAKRTFAPLTGLRHRIRDWWDRNSTRRQLNQFNDRDLQRILQELNVTKGELTDAVTRGAYPKLMLPEMLHALGLRADRLKADYPAVEADLRRVCAQCPETKRCRHELDGQTAAANYGEFCCNAATLDALLAEAARDAKGRTASNPESRAASPAITRPPGPAGPR